MSQFSTQQRKSQIHSIQIFPHCRKAALQQMYIYSCSRDITKKLYRNKEKRNNIFLSNNEMY